MKLIDDFSALVTRWVRPTPTEKSTPFDRMCAAFAAEAKTRRQTEEALRTMTEELERRVVARTALLNAANADLLRQISQRQRAEGALRENQQQLRLALEAAEIGEWQLDLETKSVMRSLRHDQIFGYNELQPNWDLDRFIAHVLPEDRAEVLAKLNRWIEGGADWDCEYRIRRPDGAVRSIWGRGKHLAEGPNAVPRAIGIVVDVTERKRAEDTAVHLAAIVESSNDAIIGKQLNGLVTSWNAAAEKMYGYSAAEMIGQLIRLLIPPERQGEEDCILAQINNGERVEHLETVRVAKDGRQLNVSITVSPIKDSAGRVIGASKIARDISDRLRAEKSLQESEERLRAVTENLTEGLIISNSEGALIYWNSAALRMHGIGRLDDAQRKFSEFRDVFILRELDGRLLPQAEWPLARILGGEILRDFEVRLHSIAAGWERVFSYRGTVIRDIEAGPLAFVTINDITERKEAEEKIRQLNVGLERRVAQRTAALEAANKELEAFSYSVSHDLRAPLRAVDGFAQAALEDYSTYLPADGQRCLQTIRNSAQRMGKLIDDLLTFSRLGRLPQKPEMVDMAALVTGVIEELRFECEGRSVEIRLQNVRSSWGDVALLQQVWTNLIANALKYTRRCDAAEVEIGSFERDGEVVWFVRDNGAGFDMNYSDKLFGVFQRLHRAGDYEGTGVGLAIVQRIVQRHGGRIWAEAEVNRGATFFFHPRR